jgi:Na+-transporting NADH:ubiquinone oxidoreductase subunit NqrE
MTNSELSRNQTLNTIQLAFEVIVGIIFSINLVVGFFVFVGDTYAFNVSLTFLALCLTIANLVFASISKNKTLPFTITNVVMAFVTFIPFIGFVSAVTGIIMSIISVIIISFAKVNPTKSKPRAQVVDVAAEVVDKLD